jgi:hypothetical protein
MSLQTLAKKLLVGTVVGSTLLLGGVRCGGGDSTGPDGRGVTAVITAPSSVDLGCGGLVEVNYSSTESTGPIVRREWRDDEGTRVGWTATLDRTFSATGSERTLLEVCAAGDVCDDDSHTVQVSPPTGCIPEAIITGPELLRLSGGSVTGHYSASSSQAAETFVWSLDGDSIGEGMTIDIPFAAQGEYGIGLLIDGDFGRDSATYDTKVFPYVPPPTNMTEGDFRFGVGAQVWSPNGLFFNGTHWFVGGVYWDSVFVYTADGTYTGTSWYPGHCSGIDGIDGDSEFIYTVCGAQHFIFINRHDGTPVDSIDISDGPTEGMGLAYTGSKWIVGDIQGPKTVYVYGPDKTLESTFYLSANESINDLDYDPSTGWLLVYDAIDWDVEDVVRFYDIATGENIFNFNYGPAGSRLTRVGIWIDDDDYTRVYIVVKPESSGGAVKEWNIETQ